MEFVVTPAEKAEAESLLLRKQLGGGSRWRTWLVLAVVLGFAVVCMYYQFRTVFPPQHRPWAIAGITVLIAAIMIWRRRQERRRDKLPVRWEISPTELVLSSDLGRATFAWSGFSECLESPKMFVLLDRAKVVMYFFPKRAFPDAAAQDWFRAQTQILHPTVLPAESVAIVNPAPADGVALDFQIGFRDFLVRNWVSWRLKGAFLLVFLFMLGVMGWQLLQPPPPTAVNGPGKMLAIMLPTVAVMLPAMWFAVSLYWWWAQRRYFVRQQLVFSARGIDFAQSGERGTLQWNTYECYLENRWCFLIWHRRNPTWQMVPKRAFAADADVARCRALLQQHLRPSRWFLY